MPLGQGRRAALRRHTRRAESHHREAEVAARDGRQQWTWALASRGEASNAQAEAEPLTDAKSLSKRVPEGH